MADLIGLNNAVKEIDTKGIPQLVGALNYMIDKLTALVNRLDGANLTITIRLKDTTGNI